MYSKQEATLIRKNFWTVLGQYLAPTPSASHEKVNWINYKTGVRYIQFHLDADNTHAKVAIKITHPDMQTRLAYFNLFKQLKKDLPGFNVNEDSVNGNGNRCCAIDKELINVNIYRQEDWPAIIGFFKENMICIDALWVANKPIFEMIG